MKNEASSKNKIFEPMQKSSGSVIDLSNRYNVTSIIIIFRTQLKYLYQQNISPPSERLFVTKIVFDTLPLRF